jgi:hypothetical protein
MGPISKKKFSVSGEGLQLSGEDRQVIKISWGLGGEMSILPNSPGKSEVPGIYKNNPQESGSL